MNFDDYAKNWDTDKRIKRAKLISDEMSREIDMSKSASAMEFGCGTGLISLNLHESLHQIDLIDTSVEMINQLNRKIESNQIANMTGKCVDITNNEQLASNYDLIYTSMALHHIPDTMAILKNFYKLLDEGGQLCLVDLNSVSKDFHSHEPNFDGHDGFDMDDLKGLVENIGFSNVRIRTFYDGVKGVGDLKVNYKLFILSASK